jgi:hypothetical protein
MPPRQIGVPRDSAVSLKHYATSQKVAGSVPEGVTGIFHLYNPSGRTVVLGSSQPLTEMSTKNISCGLKAVRALE